MHSFRHVKFYHRKFDNAKIRRWRTKGVKKLIIISQFVKYEIKESVTLNCEQKYFFKISNGKYGRYAISKINFLRSTDESIFTSTEVILKKNYRSVFLMLALRKKIFDLKIFLLWDLFEKYHTKLHKTNFILIFAHKNL